MSNGLFHTIGETAKLIGVSSATLRLWEQEGLISPNRSKSGNRLFTDAHVLRLRRIQYMRTVQGLNFAAIRLELANNEPDQANADTGSKPIDSNSQIQEIGRKLRVFRNRRGITLEQASQQSGLSLSFVSAVERGTTGASLTSLLKLVLSYKIQLADLYGEVATDSFKLVRAKERQIFEHANAGVRIEQLTHGPALMEAQYFVLEPGASSEGFYSHEGEELIYVLEGKVCFYLEENEQYSLEPGDCLYFGSTQAHRWENNGDTQTRLLWVNTPPSF